MLTAPDRDCVTVAIEAGADDTCAFRTASGELETVTGSWVRVAHPPDRATSLVIRVISTPRACDGADPAGGCPTARITRGATPACSCQVEDSDLALVPLGASVISPVVAPERDVLLEPAGAVFEVSICTEDADAFPTCSEADGQCGFDGYLWSLGQCTCLPRCRDDADCPQPRTGTVDAHCDPMGCILSCDASDTCPDGQTCVDGPNTPGSVCMRPLFEGAP